MPYTDKAHERRRAPRIKVFQPTELIEAEGEALRVHLLNVSVGGALVYGESASQPGTPVQLCCGPEPRAAHVAWCNGRRLGVKFVEPLAEAEVEAIVRAEDARIADAAERLGLPRKAMAIASA